MTDGARSRGAAVGANIRPIYWMVVACFGLSVFVTLIIGTLTGDDRYLLLAVGTAGPLIIAFFQAAFRRRISLYEPINLILLYSIIGYALASWFLGFESGYRHASVTDGETPTYFAIGGLWGLLAIASFSLAYTGIQARVPINRFLPSGVATAPSRLLLILALGGLAISLIGTLVFLQQTGGLTADSLFRKRHILVAGDGGEIVRASGGYLRLIAGLAATLAIFWMCYFASRWKMPALAQIVVVALSALAMAVPFLSSGRSDVIFVLAQLVLAYIAFRPLPIGKIVLGLAVAVALFSTMTALRSSHLSANPISSLASSANGVSIVAVSHITARVPERMAFKYGESYLRWVYAPVPRALWSQKPELGLGPEIKVKVTHGADASNTGGRPPGFAGEGFINFGHLGLIFGGLLFGGVARIAWNTFEPLIGRDVLGTALFVLILPPICQFANSGFAELVTRLGIETVSLALVILPILALKGRAGRRKPAPAHWHR